MEKTTTACARCGQELETGDTHCRRCGEPVWPQRSPRSSGPAAGEAYKQLTLANRYRLGRHLDLAEVCCAEALRLDPGNPEAYSLMGDICRDQGRVRDAIEWYRMALDRDPTRAEDRKKLEALIDREERGRPPGTLSKLGSALRRRLCPRRARTPTGPCSLGPTIALALAVAFAAAVFIALFFRQPGSSPGTTPGSASASGGFVAPPDSSPATPASEPSPLTTTRPVAEELAEDLPSLEADLLARLQARAAATDATCEVVSAEIDPLTGAASVRFTMPRLWSAAQSRRNIIRVAAALAQEVFSFDPHLVTMRARCHFPPAEGQNQVAMLCETDRETLSRGRNQNSPGEEAFKSLWWRPELRASQ